MLGVRVLRAGRRCDWRDGCRWLVSTSCPIRQILPDAIFVVILFRKLSQDLVIGVSFQSFDIGTRNPDGLITFAFLVWPKSYAQELFGNLVLVIARKNNTTGRIRQCRSVRESVKNLPASIGREPRQTTREVGGHRFNSNYKVSPLAPAFHDSGSTSSTSSKW